MTNEAKALEQWDRIKDKIDSESALLHTDSQQCIVSSLSRYYTCCIHSVISASSLSSTSAKRHY